MKKTCLLLLLLVSIIYIKEGYQCVCDDNPVKSATQGALSDVAEEVIAIPLETKPDCRLKYASRIQRDRNDLFLVSNRQLYRFDCSGKFVNQVTHNNQFQVADYVIDPIQRQLIVMDNEENVHYYNYDGTLLERKSLAGINPLKMPARLMYYDRHIWLTTQSLSPSGGKRGKEMCRPMALQVRYETQPARGAEADGCRPGAFLYRGLLHTRTVGGRRKCVCLFALHATGRNTGGYALSDQPEPAAYS